MYLPRDFGPILNVVMWLQVGIASIFVMLRIYTRYCVIHSAGWDDYMMIINMVTSYGFAIAISIGTTYGIGKHAADIQRHGLDNSKAIMWEAIGQAICIMGIAASKASVALFLLRIVRRTWHIIVLWFCIISTTILSTITAVLLFAQCRPAAYLWDHTIKGGNCWFRSFVPVALSLGAWSATMDFVLAILPWHVIISLNMKRKEKITIAVGLSLGIFAGICSIVRTIKLKSLSSTDEYVYRTAPMLLWSSSEICLTIICACIPVLRPLYMRLRYGPRDAIAGTTTYKLDKYSHTRPHPSTRDGSGTKVWAVGTAGPRKSKPSISEEIGRLFTSKDSSATATTNVSPHTKVRSNSDPNSPSEEAILKEFWEQNAAIERLGVGVEEPERALARGGRGEIVITTTVMTTREEV